MIELKYQFKIEIEDPVARRRRRRQQKALTLVDEISLFNPSNLRETRTKESLNIVSLFLT